MTRIDLGKSSNLLDVVRVIGYQSQERMDISSVYKIVSSRIYGPWVADLNRSSWIVGGLSVDRHDSD